MALPISLRIDDPSPLLSPSLVIDRGLVRCNLETMLSLAGTPDRLRPHVKTHKMPAIVRLCGEKGITKHKCATIAEAEMVASAGGIDVLLAYPVVGPNIPRLASLVHNFPATTFRALVDDPEAARALSAGMNWISRPFHVLVDLEVGMGRTGIDPENGAEELYLLVSELPNLVPDGLSAYDGHIHDFEQTNRLIASRPGVEATLRLRDRLLERGLPVPRIVLGGTPTFPLHAQVKEPEIELSPGTCILHDVSYATRYPDLPFSLAAGLLTRVISRPRPGRLCLDLGHKAVAADPTAPRAHFPDLPDAKVVIHSEEHLVVDTSHAGHYPPGSTLFAYPTHVCPTCALHSQAYVVEGGQVVDHWEVAARNRVLTY